MEQVAEPQKKSIDATEIEVTPEMVEVGLEVYNAHCPDSGDYSQYSADMVREIFETMLAAKGYKRPPPTEEEMSDLEMQCDYWRRKGWVFKDESVA